MDPILKEMKLLATMTRTLRSGLSKKKFGNSAAFRARSSIVKAFIAKFFLIYKRFFIKFFFIKKNFINSYSLLFLS